MAPPYYLIAQLGFPSPAWGVSDQFDQLERAVLAWTDGIVADHGRADDAVFAILKENLTDEQILDLTYITAMYAMYATLSRALRLEYDDRTGRCRRSPHPKAPRAATSAPTWPEPRRAERDRTAPGGLA